MGNPTYGGLVRIQSLFSKSAFPLPDFRVGIDKGPKMFYGCGLPMEHYFMDGEPSNLLLYTARAHEEVENVALCCLEGMYGLRFIREILGQACPLNNMNMDANLSFPAVSTSGAITTMEAYGNPDFVDYVHIHFDGLRDMARYGVPNPSFLDRIKMSFMPRKYTFPMAA